MVRFLTLASAASLLLTATASTALAADGDTAAPDVQHRAQEKKIERGSGDDGKTIRRNGSTTKAEPRREAPKRAQKRGPKLQGPFAKDKYPASESRRPLTLPKGMAEIGLDLKLGGLSNSAFLLATPAVAFGVTDNWEIGLNSDQGTVPVASSFFIGGFDIMPNLRWSESFVVDSHVLLVDRDHIDVAPGVRVPISFAGEGVSFEPVVLGARTRMVCTKERKLFFMLGQNLLNLAFANGLGINIIGNGGVGYQLSNDTALMADVDVFSLGLGGETNFSGVWERVDVGVGLQHSPSRKVDLGLRFDLQDTLGVEGDGNALIGAYGRFRL